MTTGNSTSYRYKTIEISYSKTTQQLDQVQDSLMNYKKKPEILYSIRITGKVTDSDCHHAGTPKRCTRFSCVSSSNRTFVRM